MVSAAASRKTVSILFCDLAGSTALGERLDPEALRELMGSWYEAMRTVLERHGATVEKFVGDAVMAVFGIPSVHEDDAFRAVQAAVEMRAAAVELGLEVRIGVNTGEVVTGDAATTLVTGDAVNTAKRLEEAAARGDVLIGDSTRRLVENATELEQVEPVVAKGKRAPVTAWRVLATKPEELPVARRLDAPLVGRRSELRRLETELEAATREQACRLVTVIGTPGVGKSRLAREFAARADAEVLTSRCVPYGDGITFLPLRGLIGEVDGSTDEIFATVRRELEAAGRERPVVLCVEDVHWAQPTFLDLVEYLAGWIREVPLLILCLARPDLLDLRPRWPGTTIMLDALTEEETGALLDELSSEWPIPPEARPLIADAADGNPLFVEQLVAMVAEQGDAGSIPPTIHGLLSARLDGLDPDERATLQRAAVAGRDFSRSAIAALSPEDEQVSPVLLALVRKELVRPAALGGDDDGFRFRHALIRDAAYAEIPKRTRADLHERFAAWLGSRDGDDELVGYHLEQAYRCREELGETDEALGSRAGALLGASGHRAYAREDMAAAANLLERAAALAELGPALLRELGRARFRIGDVDGAMRGTEAAIALAAAGGDRREEWYARLDLASHGLFVGESGEEELAEVATEAVAVFDELGDARGLAYAWQRLALASLRTWRFGDAVQQAERAIEHAARAEEPGETMDAADLLCTAFLYGPEPADAAERRARQLLELLPAPAARAAIESTLACLVAMQGRFDEARALARGAADTFDELGLRLPRAGLAELSAWVEQLAGDLAAAELERRFVFDALEAPLPAVAGIQAAQLARLTARAGRLDEATEWLERARVLSSTTDRNGIAELGLAEVELALATGRDTDAEQRARAVNAAVADTDALHYRAEASALLAASSSKAPLEAIALYEQKGNTAAAGQLRHLVETRLPR